MIHSVSVLPSTENLPRRRSDGATAAPRRHDAKRREKMVRKPCKTVRKQSKPIQKRLKMPQKRIENCLKRLRKVFEVPDWETVFLGGSIPETALTFHQSVDRSILFYRLIAQSIDCSIELFDRIVRSIVRSIERANQRAAYMMFACFYVILIPWRGFRNILERSAGNPDCETSIAA